MTVFRCAIWAVVSTETQAAEDKASLPAQQEACRQLITARGWKESAGPYVVPGASRTRWVNLRDAEQAIPELRRLLDNAHAGRFNLLVLYDFNRLRDLLDPVSRTLAAYGCQVFSVSQPVDPLPADQFDPWASDTSTMMQGLSQIISRTQLADLRRKYRYAMPRRATELGLPATHIPYGYAKPPGRETDRKAVPIQVPEEIAVLRRIFTMYLEEGMSTYNIASALTREGVPAPEGPIWNSNSVRHMLDNPFYAGRVFFGRSRVRSDPRTGRRSRIHNIPRQQWAEGQGKHEPIWTPEEFNRLHAEILRRRRANTGVRRRRFAFTSLLRCASCGATLYRQQDGPRSEPERAIWRCGGPRDGHERTAIVESVVMAAISRRIVRMLEGANMPPARQPQETSAALERARRALEHAPARRARYERAFGDGLVGYDDFAARMKEVDRDTEEAERIIAAHDGRSAAARQRRGQSERLLRVLKATPHYLQRAPREEVNDALRELFEVIVIDAKGRIVHIELRH